MDASRRRVSLAAITAVSLVLAGAASLSAAPASAKPCAHAHARPRAVGTRKAAHAVTCLLDKRRHAYGLAGFHSNPDLRRAARDHSRRMDGHGCFDHVCPGEPGIISRLTQVGYLLQGLLSWAYGEDIYWGSGHAYGTPAATVRGWMHSPAHRANIFNGEFRDIGVGIAWGTPSNARAGGGIYTADFGYRRR